MKHTEWSGTEIRKHHVGTCELNEKNTFEFDQDPEKQVGLYDNIRVWADGGLVVARRNARRRMPTVH